MLATNPTRVALLRVLVLLLSVGLTALATSPTVSAQTTATARRAEFNRLVQKALKHYKVREYLVAVQVFEAAYDLEPRPELVYNIARSYEKALKPAEAIEAYERFVDLPGTTAALRTKALDSLVALKQERSARARAEDVELPPPPTNGTEPADRVVAPSRGAPRDRTLELVLIGGGVAVVGAGAVFGVLALASQDDLDEAIATGSSDRNRINELKDETERNALLADIMYGTGALLALSGIILFVATGNASDVAVGPMDTGDGAGFSVSGRF